MLRSRPDYICGLRGAMFWRWFPMFFLIAVAGAGSLASVKAAEPAHRIEAGRKLFIRCAACHSVNPDDRRTGPHLKGIVGRPVAALPGYRYSDALRAKTFLWDERQLDLLLQNPQAIVPGLCLPFRGLARLEDRQALIAYLRQAAR